MAYAALSNPGSFRPLYFPACQFSMWPCLLLVLAEADQQSEAERMAKYCLWQQQTCPASFLLPCHDPNLLLLHEHHMPLTFNPSPRKDEVYLPLLLGNHS